MCISKTKEFKTNSYPKIGIVASPPKGLHFDLCKIMPI